MKAIAYTETVTIKPGVIPIAGVFTAGGRFFVLKRCDRTFGVGFYCLTCHEYFANLYNRDIHIGGGASGAHQTVVVCPSHGIESSVPPQ